MPSLPLQKIGLYHHIQYKASLLRIAQHIASQLFCRVTHRGQSKPMARLLLSGGRKLSLFHTQPLSAGIHDTDRQITPVILHLYGNLRPLLHR